MPLTAREHLPFLANAVSACLLRVLQGAPRRFLASDFVFRKRLNPETGEEEEYGDIVERYCESLVRMTSSNISKVREYLLVPHFDNGLRWEEKNPQGVTTMSHKELLTKTVEIPKQAHHDTFRVPTLGLFEHE